MKLFEVKVVFTKENEDGRLQKQQQTNLIETLTFADAETKALEQARPFAHLGSDLEAAAIKKVIYHELLLDDVGELADKDKAFYKAKVTMSVLDESTGREKPTALNILVEDTDVPSAHKTVQNHLKDSISDYTIDDVVKTKINEVIK